VRKVATAVIHHRRQGTQGRPVACARRAMDHVDAPQIISHSPPGTRPFRGGKGARWFVALRRRLSCSAWAEQVRVLAQTVRGWGERPRPCNGVNQQAAASRGQGRAGTKPPATIRSAWLGRWRAPTGATTRVAPKLDQARPRVTAAKKRRRGGESQLQAQAHPADVASARRTGEPFMMRTAPGVKRGSRTSNASSTGR